jgi:hypothetical protein
MQAIDQFIGPSAPCATPQRKVVVLEKKYADPVLPVKL